MEELGRVPVSVFKTKNERVSYFNLLNVTQPLRLILYFLQFIIIESLMTTHMDGIMHKWANPHKKTMKMSLIATARSIYEFHIQVRLFCHLFCYLSVLICIYSFYHVLHLAARFFLKMVKMWVSPLVLDAIHMSD